MYQTYELLPYEYYRYQNHLLALDNDSRYTRFGFLISDELIKDLCQQFQAHFIKHKIFVVETTDLNVIGAAHVAINGDKTELALSVLKEHRNKGIASLLMERAVKWCQNRNIRSGQMICLSSNTAIKHIAMKHGILKNEGIESTANLSIPEPTPFTIMNEVIETNLSRLDHLGKLQGNIIKRITFPLSFI